MELKENSNYVLILLSKYISLHHSLTIEPPYRRMAAQRATYQKLFFREITLECRLKWGEQVILSNAFL